MSRPASTSDGHRIDLASVGAGACFLGLTPILYELSSTSPATGAFFRCLYAIPFLALLAAAQRGSTPSTRSAGSWVFKAVVAGVFFAGDLLLWHQAINGIGAGLATVLNSLQVVFAAVLGLVVLRQRISRQLWCGMPVLLIGVALVANVLQPGSSGTNLLGTGLAILSGAAYASYIVLIGPATRAAGQSSGPMLVAAVSTTVTVGLVGLLQGSLDLTPPLAAQGWLVVLALDAQVIGWLLVSKASRRLPAGSIAAGLVLQSAAAMVFSAVLLAQLPTVFQTIGAVLILIGVGASMAPSRRRPTSPVLALS